MVYESQDEVFAIETNSHAINSEAFVNIWWTPAYTIPKNNIWFQFLQEKHYRAVPLSYDVVHLKIKQDPGAWKSS